MDKMRQEFEAWAGGYNLYRSELGGHYVDGYVNGMWNAWCASRATLCIELPDSWIGGEMGDDADLVATVDIKEALDQAGVSYK